MSGTSLVLGITVTAALSVAIIATWLALRRPSGTSQQSRRWRLILAAVMAAAAVVAGIAGLIAGSVWGPVWNALILIIAGLNIRDALSAK
jgi:cytochrome bd-type quinol oxidase subunit 2